MHRLLLGGDPFPLLLVLSLKLDAKFRKLRAPESAKVTPRLPCSTAAEADHQVLKETGNVKGSIIQKSSVSGVTW